MRAIFLFSSLSNSPACCVRHAFICTGTIKGFTCLIFVCMCVGTHTVLEPLGTHQKPVAKLTKLCAQQKESHVFLIPSSALLLNRLCVCNGTAAQR